MEVTLGPPKQRAVLALLASRVNDVVSFDEIVDAVWGANLPKTAANGVHTYIAGLRNALQPERGSRDPSELIASTGGGYMLFMEPEDLDVAAFLRRAAHARRLQAQEMAESALEEYGSALGLWRGDAYANVPGPFAAIERTRLNELRMAAVEEWGTLMMAQRRTAELVPVLCDMVAKEPLREKLRWLLMLAMYRCARRADALAVYRQGWQLLHDELGIDPSPQLQDLHQRILTGDPAPDRGSRDRPSPDSRG